MAYARVYVTCFCEGLSEAFFLVLEEGFVYVGPMGGVEREFHTGISFEEFDGDWEAVAHSASMGFVVDWEARFCSLVKRVLDQ